jgi:exopolyphosphatase/guanosine-5'-triphosphate,3'-diphosphate pyrophosphatase
MRVAAIDIGTNTTRLLVTDGTVDYVRHSEITRLGQGVDAQRRLGREPMDRTAEALAGFRREWEAAGASRIRIVATSAARDAVNSAEFFDLVEAATEVRPELLSGTDEAALAFAGASAGFDATTGPLLVVDIGGGSTEFIYGHAGEVLSSVSIDVGSVRLTERDLRSDPPKPEELTNAIAWVRDHLEDVERALPEAATAARLVGVAGTITTVAAVELGLVTYDRDQVHHFTLTRDAAEEVFRTLATERLADRVHNPGLPRARADVIVGGCCVLVAVFRWLGATEMTVSESDLLDGVAASLLLAG